MREMGRLKSFLLAILVSLLLFSYFIVDFLLRPTNSLQVYHNFVLAEDYETAIKFMQKGYEENYTLDEYNSLDNDSVPNRVRQFTVIQYSKQDVYLIETTPGTMKMKVLEVEKLPKDIAKYIYEIE